MKTLCRTISLLCVSLLSVCVFLLVGARLVGFTPYMVLSGSMEPSYPVGSLVYVKKVPKEQIKIGDVITFLLQDQATVITHQVVEIDHATQTYATKGLANAVRDGSSITYDAIIGKVFFCIPYLGYFSAWLGTTQGITAIFTASIVWLVALMLAPLLRKNKSANPK